RPLGSNTIEFYGSIPRGAKPFEVNISVNDPALYAATLLREALARRGITVMGRVRQLNAVARVAMPLDETKLTELAFIESQPLSVLLKVINKPSQNLHTEIMLRQLGVRYAATQAAAQNAGAAAASGRGDSQTQAAPAMPALDDYGRPKSTESYGLQAIRLFLQRAGIDTSALSLRDGSGLARQNLVSPRSTSRLLEFMQAHPHFSAWRDSLTIAGVDGTLERRMRGTPAEGNARGKTGTLSYVNALSGYLQTRRGQTLIFSFYGNNYTGPGRDVTSTFDQICALLAGYEGEL
ncbi:MAG: D-alanyl-D-alanine carboxypeptidase/D-alanyl-D-alanine-endopeptidase, partial [Blastocatellia bacterium]